MTTRPQDDDCECRFFDEGDWVESRLNTNEFGIVVAEYNWGQTYYVQLAGTSEVRPYYGVTLRHMESDTPEPPVTAREGNVVNGNFPKYGKLNADTPTDGAA